MPHETETCTELMREGYTDRTCHDFRKIRALVMCEAWHKESGSMRDRIREAWREAVTECAAHGGVKPEEGFLEPVGVEQVTETHEIRDKDGKTVGTLVVNQEGNGSLCLNDSCQTVHHLGTVRSVLEQAGYKVG